MNIRKPKQTALTLDELKELLRLAFYKGIAVGKKMKPLNGIPMGSEIKSPMVEFHNFYTGIINDLKTIK